MKKMVWLAGLALTLCVGGAQANNIAVTNVVLWNQRPADKCVHVDFTVSWENSFRDEENWDAAWVFVKFRAPGASEWEHATLSAVSAEHQPAAGSVIDAVPDGTGALVYRSTPGIGNVSYAHTRLRWNYGANGYDFAQGVHVDVAVHAIEMVFVPAGPFYLGSGGTEVAPFYEFTDGTQNTKPYLVSSEDEIVVGTGNGNLYYNSTGPRTGDRGSPIPAVFPKGYKAFYCMKYEISQGQWVDFFNMLTPVQKINRDVTGNNRVFKNTDAVLNRNTISWFDVGDATCTTRDRACNHLAWADGAAYCDWAGLRPMTELEFEKACRGPANPVPNEYAWGSTNITPQTGYDDWIDGSGTETAAPPTANSNQSVTQPVRCGIFAKSGSDRVSAGATYYGIMEMTGNVTERVITVGHWRGRLFDGQHGNGILPADGDSDVPNMPPAGHLAPSAEGSGVRGNGRVSDRNDVAYREENRMNYAGFRCVRTAP